LIVNRNKFSTIEDLELYAGIGAKTLRKAVNENREPSRRILGKLLESLNISDEEWASADFTPFMEVSKSTEQSKIPFYDAYAMGGLAVLADQSAVSEPTEMIDPGTFLRAATGTLRVYGHSMYPKYPAGCIVAFKASSTAIPAVIFWGEDYVIETADRRVVKKVDKGTTKDSITAISYNGGNSDKEKYQFQPTEINLKDIKRMYMVLGKVELEASI